MEPTFPEEKIFKKLLKKFNFVVMATRVFDGIKLGEQFLKRTSLGTFLPSLVQIGSAVWEEMFNPSQTSHGFYVSTEQVF